MSSIDTDVSVAPVEAGSRIASIGVAVMPIVVLVAIVAAVLAGGDRILGGFGHNPPPADEVVVDRVHFVDGHIEVSITNPQSDPITPAVVYVDSAIAYGVEGLGEELGRHDDATLVIPYPWIQDDPYTIDITSSSGITTTVDVPAAVPAARVDAGGLGWGALIGILVGVVPVALGLAWLPAMRRLRPSIVAGFVAFTGGLLLFLAIDATAEAFDVQARVLPAFGGAGLIAMGIVASMVAISLLGRWLRHGVVEDDRDATSTAMTLALLVAVGIGVHNLGEGLAIGSSFSLGEGSLAVSLIVGFMVHNLTEGIGIAAPIASARGSLRAWPAIGLALVAGVPAVAGIWLGRYVEGNLFAALCFSIAAGAALQVVVEVSKFVRRAPGGGFTAPGVQAGFALGMVAMWLTGSLAG
ncbi:MAG: putative metal cation transporter [Thermoleophilia bacterium]|nr:putative metal cation transporter [Thermoleophilia bacterium]